ncbi:helix-turn-helix domain-containing protein [Leptospira stimsonii]|uniref:XRE family transcriptional regulator n=1 Tax=Leptospira stimsonii TaxID=2202203 RepID=A0ABY2MXT0_9LEPT|nr:helix-turn-helix transcriptional regulator [Leptospira stimsonii]TGK10714.1 XRE family transcriptional regulator [Leptospira stimsonii]TGM11004.1 XRE family transcriptional regulator [Leptospira stimsonii]
MTIKERLESIEEEYNLTHDEFANEIGSSRRQYYAYKKGELAIPALRLDKIESKFNVRREWIKEGKGEKYITDEFSELDKKIKLIKKLESYGILNYLESLPPNPPKSKKTILQEFLGYFLSRFADDEK